MNKLILLTILIAAAVTQSALAQTNFLTELEAVRADSYMDNICPDTYCGGDIAFYTQGLTCSGNSCTLELTGGGYSEFDNQAVAAAVNTSKVTKEYKNVVINFGAMSVTGIDEDGFEGANFAFSCTMNDLPMNMNNYREKQDLIYDLVVWGCIRELETTVYNY